MDSGFSPFTDHVARGQVALSSRYEVEGGLPHSEIPGSKLVRSSPRLIAAYHVLHRLSAPRHPPNALKTLDRSHDRCPPLGSDAHRVQKDHFRSQTPERPRAGVPMIGNGACRTRPIRLQAGRGRLKPRTCSLFTMSNIRRPRTRRRIHNADTGPWGSQTGLLVEPDGIEPTTSCLQSTRSPN